MKRTPKIRINELARELEVKASAILEVLPQVGIEGKKTHSSSVEESVAEKIRALIRGESRDGAEPKPAEETAPKPQSPETAETARPAAKKSSSAKDLPKIRPSIPVGRGGTPLRPPVQALRPPLRKGGAAGQPPAPPSGQSTVGPAPRAPARAPARPAAPDAPAKKARPSAPTPAARPVKPIPSQPETGRKPAAGPRAPLSDESGRRPQPAAKARPVAPGKQAAGRPSVAPRTPAGRRPIVPPGRRGGAASQQKAGARGRSGQSTATKPVVVPGKPIYQRPKPSGPMPGMPRPAPQRPGMPRPMHPVGRYAPGAPSPGTRPAHDTRRARPGPQQRQVRDKEAEREEKVLRRQAAAKAAQTPPVAVNKEITVSEGTTVKELAEKLGIKANVVIKTLVDRGLFATINQTLDLETIKDLCKYFGATTTEVTFEEEALGDVELAEESSDLVPRAPVVTVMGHVDHGKTSVLDAIRKTNVAEREAGGITQAIGAYHVTKNGRRIVFIDTPGHEAFTRMRARGAEATDVVILVVAADDGVMPQTVEAIDHAKAADVPILVAINKIDKPGADPDRVKQQLADRGLLPEDWGGDVVMVPVSAHTNENLDLLLEMVLLVSDMKEPKANPNRPAAGTVLECKLDRGQGPVATVLVQNGTLQVGDYFLVGSVFGKVRALLDDRGEQVEKAPPSSAVVVLGLEGLPEPGDAFQVVTDTEKAKKIVEYRENKAREQALAKTARLSLDQLQEQLREGEVKELPIVLKGDVQGSVEVLTDALEKLSTEQVKVRLIRGGVGAISESDVLLAATANAVIIGFNVRPEKKAAALAERENIDVRLHTVIYELIDEIKRAMAGLLEPVTKETFHGRADVLETFHVSKVGTVAGCVVQEGRVTRNSEVRLLRDNVVVYTGRVASLRRFKDEASEVRAGQECGIGLENFGDIKQGDVIEAFATEQVAQEILV